MAEYLPRRPAAARIANTYKSFNWFYCLTMYLKKFLMPKLVRTAYIMQVRPMAIHVKTNYPSDEATLKSKNMFVFTSKSKQNG